MDPTIKFTFCNLTLPYTQRGLAAAIETTDKTISSYMHGQANPPLATIVAISKELNLTSDFLLGLSNEIKELENTNNPIDEEILIIRQAYTAMTDVQRDAVAALVQSIVYPDPEKDKEDAGIP